MESGTVICIELLMKINYTSLYLSDVQISHIGTKCSAGGNCTKIFNVNSDFNIFIVPGFSSSSTNHKDCNSGPRQVPGCCQNP